MLHLFSLQLYETAQGILYLHDLKMVHGDINWVRRAGSS
jgi:hypothetical protein